MLTVRLSRSDGWTLLHVSVWPKNSNIEVVKLLIDREANVNAQTEKMETPFHLLVHAMKAVLTNEKTAKRNSNKKKNVSGNENKDVGEDKEEERDLKSNLIEIAKILIDNGAEISVKDKYWRTPLFLDRWYNISELILLLT